MEDRLTASIRTRRSISPEIRKLVLEGKIREAQKLELFALVLEHLRANGRIRPCVM